MNSMIFIIVGTGVIVSVLSFFLVRTSSDYASAQQARVKSAIYGLSTNLLGQFNSEFPTAWQDSTTDLKTVTADLGKAPQQQANAWVEAYSFNKITGVIALQVRGESTQPGHIAVTAEIKFIPSGAAVFTGTDSNGRPTWIYTSANLDSLALWQLSSAIQYITPGGTYDLTAPSQIPTADLVPTPSGADGKIGTVICKYFSTTEYQYRVKNGNDEFGDWSVWGSTRTISFPMSEGDHIEFEARARCVNDSGATDPSGTSPTATYSKPFKTVLQGPQVTVSTAGVVSWGSVSCASGSVEQYQFNSAVNDGAYSAWSDWAPDQSFTIKLDEGSKLDAQVRAHCKTSFVTGPNSTVGSGTAIAPIVSVPTAPNVTLSGAVIAQFTATSCPANSTSEIRYEWAKNGAVIVADSWTGWSPQAAASFIAKEGQRTAVVASQHCLTQYAVGPASASSTLKSIDTAVTSIPGTTAVSLATDGNTFTIGATVCPAETTAKLKYSYQANGGAVVYKNDQWYSNPGPTAVNTINEGGTLSVTIQAACTGYTGAPGPANAEKTTNLNRAITTVPAVPTFSVSTVGNTTIYTSGCPAGTTRQFQSRQAVNSSPWSGFSSYGSDNTRSTVVNEGDNLIVGANVRCANATTGVTGPANYGESGWTSRGVSAPQTPGYIARTGISYYGITWSGANCASGTRGDYVARIFRPGSLDSGNVGLGGSPYYNYGASAPRGSTLYFDTYSRCVNDATGAASGWSYRGAYWGGNPANNASGYPIWQ